MTSEELQEKITKNMMEKINPHGSIMYSLTWKTKTTPLGRRICQLVARERPIEDSGYSGWLTPIVQNSKHATVSPAQKDKKTLDVLARMVPWPTPTVRDWKDGATTLQNTPVNALLGRQVLGIKPNGSNAQTENQGRLNPSFSRWLMGYPKAWCEAAIEAWHQMPINRRKREQCD